MPQGSGHSSGLLTPSDIRELATALNKRPTKTLGQNFVHDAGTVRRIVRDAGVQSGDAVLEIGPGLGSLTLALLETGAYVSAVEIDPILAGALPTTVAARMPEAAPRFAVQLMDAMEVSGAQVLAVPEAWGGERGDSSENSDDGEHSAVFEPRRLVANLPYNVAVPVILTLLEKLPSLETVLVMVQAEVADRLAAGPGSRTYGVPSVKAAWYADAARGAKVSRTVFWPVPNVDSALVSLTRHPILTDTPREEVFAVVDAAFAQRRKTLRAALSSWAGSPALAEEILVSAGVSPQARGEKLGVEEFIAIADAARRLSKPVGGGDYS
ncbi:MAG: 16S rRNA (adenine(1518)-N(6)/adenine(1519)-N(6))-dimethyltransferase RsmA [Ancrocorticia sp.]